MKQLLLIAGAIFALIVVVIVVFAFTGLGGAIKAIVEGVGSRATGTQVTLASADVSLTSGEGALKGLVVGNPAGYKTPSAIELDHIRVKVDTSTVTSSTVVIKEILIEGPRLTYEVGAGGTNIGTIQENVASFRGGKPSAEPAKGGDTKMVIESLVVRGGRVTVSAGFLEGKDVAATLPDIRLSDIGKAEGGVTSDVVAAKILEALTKGAIDAVKDLGLDRLEKKANEAIGDAIKDAADKILGGKKKK